MYKRILIPTDGSREARKAAKHGVGLAGAFGATVHTLYVIDLPGSPRTPYIMENEDRLREEYEEYGREVTRDVCEIAEEAGVECVTALKYGSPYKQISKYAENEDMDCIVLGFYGRADIPDYVLGTTAERVVRTATVPVITVRRSKFKARDEDASQPATRT
jgi:nucleotide-binding universal stress UspA family protein